MATKNKNWTVEEVQIEEPLEEKNYEALKEEFDGLKTYLDFLETKIRVDELYEETLRIRSEDEDPYQHIASFIKKILEES